MQIGSQRPMPIITFKNRTPKRIKDLKKRFILQYNNPYNQPFDFVSSQEYDEILQHIAAWRSKQIIIPDFDEPPKFNIFKQIQHIKFTKLQFIDIRSCDILNIEPLALLYCPLLQNLRLSDNMINCLKPFAKCSLPKLHLIRLQANMFNHGQLNYMTRIRSDNENIKRIDLSRRITLFFGEHFKQRQQPRIQIVTQLIKYESTHLDRIQFSHGYPNNESEQRLFESKIIMSQTIRQVFQRRSFDDKRTRIYDRFSVQGSSVISC